MTNIEWTDRTWQVTHGCKKVAPGCANCYAIRDAHRMAGHPNPKISEPRQGLTKRVVRGGHPDDPVIGTDWTGVVRTAPENLDKPLRWKKPQRIFVNSNSDLFHKDVPFEFIAAVYGVMAACPQHTFQVLTKRPERMLEFFEWAQSGDLRETSAVSTFTIAACTTLKHRQDRLDVSAAVMATGRTFPLPNVWHGVSIANQKDADKNLPILLKVPSAIRFVSAEPLIDYVDLEPWLQTTSELADYNRCHENAACDQCGGEGFREYNDTPEVWGEDCPSEVNHIVTCPECGGAGTARWYQRLIEKSDDQNALDWVIVGGESGPNARPCGVGWIRSVVQQCKAAGVPVFVKQVGSQPRGFGQWEREDNEGYGVDPELSRLTDKKGGDPTEWPEDIRVREMPAPPTTKT